MADPLLIVRDESSNLLFDTRNITYGLVKSGYMSVLEYWTRRTFKGGNVDPAIGANWTESTVEYAPATNNDVICGFTVANARSPICFITGGGSLNSINRNSDGSATFYYTGATSSSKFYCYDLMSDFMPGTTFLKTFRNDGVLTFNSLQPPLNILTTVEAPAAGGFDQRGGVYRPYDLGSGSFFRSPLVGMATYRFYVKINLNVGECAVHLPWSRGAQVRASYQNSTQKTYHGVAEGAFGGLNEVNFCFVEAGGTPNELAVDFTGQVGTYYAGFVQSPRPVAMVVSTATLPFPFN